MDELDLHNLSVSEALQVFAAHYNLVVGRDERETIRVVHGYGKSGQGGDIRRKLRQFLQLHRAELDYEAGEDVEGNPGSTLVYPHRPLPSAADEMTDTILAFCAQAKSQDKIVGKLRNYGEPEILKALRRLERQGLLQTVWKGKVKCYVTRGR